MTDDVYTAGVVLDMRGVYREAGVLFVELEDVPGVLKPVPGV